MALDLSKFDWSTPTAASSAQLKTDHQWHSHASSPVPTPAPTVTPTPQPSSNSGSSSSGGKQNGGWYWDSNLGKSVQYWAPGQGPSSGGSSGGSSGPSYDQRLLDKINSMFSSNNKLFDQQESAAKSEYDSSLEQLNKDFETARTHSQQNYDLASQSQQGDQEDLSRTYRSALEQAVRAYNAMGQQRISRFGGGSSAGEAIGELAQSEYFRGQSQVNQQYISEANKLKLQQDELRLKKAQADDYFTLELERGKSDLKTKYSNALSRIQMMRSENETAKSQMRTSVMAQFAQEARALDFQIKERRDAFYDQLALFEAQNSGSINALKARADQWEAQNYLNYSNEYAGNDFSQRAAQGQPAYRFNPYTRSEDEETSINPFFQG